MRETGRREREKEGERERGKRGRDGGRKREREYGQLCAVPPIYSALMGSAKRERGGRGKGTDVRDGKTREGRRKGWQRMKMWGEGEKKRDGVREGF